MFDYIESCYNANISVIGYVGPAPGQISLKQPYPIRGAGEGRFRYMVDSTRTWILCSYAVGISVYNGLFNILMEILPNDVEQKLR